MVVSQRFCSSGAAQRLGKDAWAICAGTRMHIVPLLEHKTKMHCESSKAALRPRVEAHLLAVLPAKGPTFFQLPAKGPIFFQVRIGPCLRVQSRPWPLEQGHRNEARGAPFLPEAPRPKTACSLSTAGPDLSLLSTASDAVCLLAAGTRPFP